MRRRLFVVAVLLAVSSAAAAQTVPVYVVRVYDGDTVTADANPWPGVTVRTSVRVRGLDTPEIRGQCPEERAAALEARDVLRELLDAAIVIAIAQPEHGLYAGRVVATLLADGVDVGQVLIARGLARPYGGGARKPWCFGPNAAPQR